MPSSGRRMTDAGKEIVKGGGIPPDWQANPRKPAQKDRDARWTLKRGRRKTRPDGTAMGAIATPVFGCKSHINADRRHGFVRTWIVTDAAQQADARASREGQCRRFEGPIRDRTSLRRDEGTNGALRPHHRHRPGEGQERHGQYRSQHETAPVPGAQRRRVIARPRRNQIPNHTTQAKGRPTSRPQMRSRHPIPGSRQGSAGCPIVIYMQHNCCPVSVTFVLG